MDPPALDGADAMVSPPCECHRARTTATLAGSSGSSSGSGQQPALAEVGRVGETGGVALHDPDPGAAIATAGDLFDAAVVETGGSGPLVLGVHLGELRTRTNRCRQHSLQHVLVDHERQATDARRRCREGCGWGVRAPFRLA
jgi:hypothetical protein